jgi:hypothetical protein
VLSCAEVRVAEKKLHTNWSKLQPDQAAAEIARRVDGFERGTTWRHEMAARGLNAYQGRGTRGLFDHLNPGDRPRASKRSKTNGGWGNKHRWNLARAISETFAEKLTGLDEPKTQMVATDAEWEIRRQGVWADRFIEGNMHEGQGVFLDGWDLCRHGFLLSAVSTGTVAARVEEDYVSKRVNLMLRSTLNTFIDPGDVANGRPLTYVDVTWENPEYLVEDVRFKKHKDHILRSAVVPPHIKDYDGSPCFDTPMVKVVSAWRMPFGSFTGREARFIGGKSVLWEKWEHPTPPLAFFGMTRCLGDSFWNENFIEIMMGALDQVDDVAVTAENTMRLTSQTIALIDAANCDPAAIKNAKDVNVIPYDSRKGGSAPQIIKAGLLHADYFSWLDRNVEMAMRLNGMSDMHVMSQSPAGTDSGRAKRLEASLLPERHAKKQRNWRHWVAVDIAKLWCRAAQRIGKVEPKWQVTWPGQDFDAKVGVGVLDIDLTQYTMRPYAVSEQKNTPADRAQAAQEMFDRGEITNEQLSIILNGAYDVPREGKGFSTQRRYVAKVCDEILHAEESEIADENEWLSERYIPPPPWLKDHKAAREQAAEIYTQALIDGVPQNRRNLLRRFIEDLDAQIQKNAQEEAALSNTNVSVDATMGQAFPALDAGQSPMPGDPNAAAAPAPPVPAINTGGIPAAA